MISYDEALIHSDAARVHGSGDRALTLIRCSYSVGLRNEFRFASFAGRQPLSQSDLRHLLSRVQSLQ